MFTPGDYVVYSIEGVCRVEEAGRLNVPGLECGRDYYRLTPPSAARQASARS